MNSVRLERLNSLLDEKSSIISDIIAEAKEQNAALKNDDFEKTLFHDSRKMPLLKKLSENDAALKEEFREGIPEEKTIQIKAEKINLSFEELINLERQNNVLANDAVALMSGERVNAYLRQKKP